MSLIVEQLQTLAAVSERSARYKTAYQSVLDHGRAFVPPERPRPKGMRRMTKRLCFSNSFRLADELGATYVEGFAMPEGIPLAILHAWVVTPEGVVIDPTWTTAGVEYFGIPFRLEYVRHAALSSTAFGILDNMRWREFATHDPERFLKTL